MCKFYEPQVSTCKYVIFEVIIDIFPSFTDTVKHNSYHLIFLNATFMFHLYKYQTYKTLSRRAIAHTLFADWRGTFYILSLTQFVLTHMCFTLALLAFLSKSRHSIQGFHTISLSNTSWTMN